MKDVEDGVLQRMSEIESPTQCDYFMHKHTCVPRVCPPEDEL
jgi:hypothetical protein